MRLAAGRSAGRGAVGLILGVALAATGCASASPTAGSTSAASAPQRTAAPFEVTTAWADFGAIPAKYTCQGEDASPPVEWKNAPAGTAEIVLIMDDYGPAIAHWIVLGIPGTASGSLPEGYARSRTGPGRSLFYLGPCPNEGAQDAYRITLYALSTALDAGDLTHMSPEVLAATVRDSISDKELAEATIMGLYRRTSDS